MLEDEDSAILAFLNNFVGRGMAKTHNALLIAAAGAGGTSLKTFASATAIAAGELEDIVGNDALDNYLDDSGSVSWVMKNSVKWEVMSLLGDNRIYGTTPLGAGLLGYPAATTAASGATAASTKSVYFGNWSFVGLREAPSFQFLRDPYSYEAGIELRYQFRAVYKVLQAEAIGYGVHPAS